MLDKQIYLVCPICLALFQDPHMLSCGHNFCLACLQGCLPAGAEGAPCPECRLPFQLRGLVPFDNIIIVIPLFRHFWTCPLCNFFLHEINK
uniref:RING-type domain-containing protein n=1 Tax=Anolis carolinensis TaxID=28377 RepID=A0A803T4F9_ANOCA